MYGWWNLERICILLSWNGSVIAIIKCRSVSNHRYHNYPFFKSVWFSLKHLFFAKISVFHKKTKNICCLDFANDASLLKLVPLVYMSFSVACLRRLSVIFWGLKMALSTRKRPRFDRQRDLKKRGENAAYSDYVFYQTTDCVNIIKIRKLDDFISLKISPIFKNNPNQILTNQILPVWSLVINSNGLNFPIQP